MLFSEYLDSIQGTIDEKRLIEHFIKSKDGLSHAAKIPVAGRIMKALIHIGECESIEEFKKSKHYNFIKHWDIDIDLDKQRLNISPSKELKAKWLGIASAVVSAAITAIAVTILLRRANKK